MAQRMYESGEDGRSVLGMLAVQVEKDPQTGATTVKSVAPLSTPAGAPMAPTVFDDGRKSIHTISGSMGHPSIEELGQILSVIDGVGMKVLLDEVTVTPDKPEIKIEHVEASNAPEGKIPSISNHPAVSKENSFKSDDVEATLGQEDSAVNVVNVMDEEEDRSMTVVRDIAGEVENIDDQMLDEGPVTLVFLGYTDATSGHSTDVCEGQEDHEGMLMAERVIITDEGEEIILGSETCPSLQPTLDEAEARDQKVEKDSQDKVFQNVPLDGNGAQVKVPGVEGEKELHNSSSASRAEGEVSSKHKTCQCCSVM
ncbi:paralemmin-1-like [Sphaeramia orbicularis]|uniref:paralemmin-1-like n=1 Tax=Sphaeramia orbicularis TaxID=375764 RepID=UPI00117E8961|nr:paralemmin-1-like [Sphaeramia orbicularis]